MVPSMTYWPVQSALTSLVDAIYVFRCDAREHVALAGALLPQLHWLLEGSFAWRCRDGVLQPLHGAGALGPSTAALSVETRGRTVVVGFGVFPEGWAALLPVPAGTLVEQLVDLTGLWGDEGREPLALDPAADDTWLAAQIETLLLRRLPAAKPVDPRIIEISRWANGTEHDIAKLARRLGVTHRHLHRLTTAAHGLPPRLLANKHKVLRMAAVLATGAHDNRRDTWTQEYADQAHFNRNFRRFIGTTPTRFMSDESLLVRDVMRVRLGLASDHPLGLARGHGGVRDFQ